MMAPRVVFIAMLLAGACSCAGLWPHSNKSLQRSLSLSVDEIRRTSCTMPNLLYVEVLRLTVTTANRADKPAIVTPGAAQGIEMAERERDLIDGRATFHFGGDAFGHYRAGSRQHLLQPGESFTEQAQIDVMIRKQDQPDPDLPLPGRYFIRLVETVFIQSPDPSTPGEQSIVVMSIPSAIELSPSPQLQNCSILAKPS